jgi:DNA-directed RNA polymerase subunit M/transcription elongation factor TFIIS
MEITKSDRDAFINKLTKLKLNDKTAKLIEDDIYDFSIKYSIDNDTPYLLPSIYDTKISEILSYLNVPNSFLLNAIKNKEININNISYLRPDELNPEQFKHIKDKKKLEEAKKNSKIGTSAFTCPKCKKKNSKITERQMRSGDEPPTIFITCLECEHSHKM